MSPRASFYLLLPLMLVASVARADPELFVALDYELDTTHDSCPSEHRFRSMVSAELGYDPFRSLAPLTVLARAHSHAGGLRGSIEWFDTSGGRRGERQLSSDDADCAELARAMSFAIAVQIQLLAQEAGSTSTAPKTSSARDAATPARASTKSSQTRPGAPRAPGSAGEASDAGDASGRAEREHLTIFAGGGPFVALGMAPRAAPGVRAFGAARYDWFLLELGLEVTLPASYATSNTAGFDQHVALGSMAGCLALSSWSICSVSKVGRIYVRGFGVDVPEEASGTMALTGGRLSVSRELAGSWLAAPRIECLLPVGSWDVTLNRRRVWTTPSVSASLGVDLAWFF